VLYGLFWVRSRVHDQRKFIFGAASSSTWTPALPPVRCSLQAKICNAAE
jgi:hypothetical protein